jgi:hypothetical protein
MPRREGQRVCAWMIVERNDNVAVGQIPKGAGQVEALPPVLLKCCGSSSASRNAACMKKGPG